MDPEERTQGGGECVYIYVCVCVCVCVGEGERVWKWKRANTMEWDAIVEQTKKRESAHVTSVHRFSLPLSPHPRLMVRSSSSSSALEITHTGAVQSAAERKRSAHRRKEG